MIKTNKVAIYVPEGNPVMYLSALDTLCRMFGGATEIDARGNWLNDNNILIEDNIKICYSYCTTKELAENMQKLYGFCETLKSVLKQECILLVINNEARFI
jgi:hypothetical protein